MVCSPEEVATLRAETDPDTMLVIPGMRPAGSEVGDQKRIATPGETIARGASMLVVGRPITPGSRPAAAAQAILDEIARTSNPRKSCIPLSIFATLKTTSCPQKHHHETPKIPI